MGKLARGIGFNNNAYPSNNSVKEYCVWNQMLFRCTEEGWDKLPTYAGVTCSENFKYYSFFYEWCNRQVGFGNIDENGRSWQLDKDLLVTGNKHYSEDTCVFVPHRINSLLIKSDLARGKFPVGVYFKKKHKKFVAQCNVGSFQRHLGYFINAGDAFEAYKTFKESLIKEVANEYRYQLDHRAYLALMAYKA